MGSALDAALRELERARLLLDSRLLLDANFVDLHRLDAEDAAGQLLRGPAVQEKRSRLLAALSTSPLYQARTAIDAAAEFVRGAEALRREQRELVQGRMVSAMAGAAAAQASSVGPAGKPSVAASVVVPAVPHVLPAADGPPEDLTRIRGINRELAGELGRLGIVRCDQIAAWRAADVAHVAVTLGLGREIQQRNWIEQAALLAARAKAKAPSAAVAFAPKQAVTVPTVTTVAAQSAEAEARAPLAEPPPQPRIASRARTVGPAELHAVAAFAAAARAPRHVAIAPPAPVPPPPAAPRKPDDLTAIHGIDAALARRLTEAGIRHYADIAGWSSADLEAGAAALGVERRRIAKAGWIEQAALLAAGRTTAYARDLAWTLRGCLVPSPPPPPPRVAQPTVATRRATRPLPLPIGQSEAIAATSVAAALAAARAAAIAVAAAPLVRPSAAVRAEPVAGPAPRPHDQAPLAPSAPPVSRSDARDAGALAIRIDAALAEVQAVPLSQPAPRAISPPAAPARPVTPAPAVKLPARRPAPPPFPASPLPMTVAPQPPPVPPRPAPPRLREAAREAIDEPMPAVLRRPAATLTRGTDEATVEIVRHASAADRNGAQMAADWNADWSGIPGASARADGEVPRRILLGPPGARPAPMLGQDPHPGTQPSWVPEQERRGGLLSRVLRAFRRQPF